MLLVLLLLTWVLIYNSMQVYAREKVKHITIVSLAWIHFETGSFGLTFVYL